MTNESPRKDRAALARAALAKQKKRQNRSSLLFGIGIALVFILIVGGAFIFAHPKSSSSSDGSLDKPKNPNTVVVPTGATKDYGLIYNPKNVTSDKIVVVEDTQCPVCDAFDKANGKWLQNLAKEGKASLEYRQIAFLDDKGSSTNNYGRRSTNVLYCVNEDAGIDAFLKLHTWLYADDHQPEEGTAGPSDKTLYGDAKAIDPTVSESCIMNETYEPYVAKATKAILPTITGTPFVMVNGKVITAANGTVPARSDIQKALDASSAS